MIFKKGTYTIAKRKIVREETWLDQIVIIKIDLNGNKRVEAFDILQGVDHLNIGVKVLRSLEFIQHDREVMFLKECDSFARKDTPNWEFYSKAPDTIISMETLLRYRLGKVQIAKA